MVVGVRLQLTEVESHPDGTFDVAVSRTVPGERGEVIDRFAELVDGSLGGVDLDGQGNNGVQDRLKANVFLIGTRLAF